MGKLSQMLLELGFFSALGTTEYAGDEQIIVRRGNPFSFDENNGVIVVYDEDGRPWIIRQNDIDDVTEVRRTLTRTHSLRWGASVPHSNDGGYFVREVLPNL